MYFILAVLIALLILILVQMYRMRQRYRVQNGIREQHRMQQKIAAQQAMDDFLWRIAQELREPLNNLVTLGEALTSELSASASPALHENAILMISNSKRLARLINNMYDYAQIKHDHLVLRRKNLDLRVLVDVIFAANEASIKHKSIVCINQIPTHFPAVVADEERLMQVLQHLVSNAIKFTDKGVISISAALNEDWVRVAVSDTGAGIPMERINTIFDEAQPVLDKQVEYRRTGFGLALTKRLVELHGGSIRVESVERVGTTFYFTLPMTYRLPAATPPAELSDVFVEQELHSPLPSTIASTPNINGNRILVVDDDPGNRKVIVNLLLQQGYYVIAAANGAEAMAIIEAKTAVDLVLLDTIMPQQSGYEVCRQLRKYYASHELPIILLTSSALTSDWMMVFESGANDFLLKPIAPAILLARVATHLQLHDALRHLDKKVAERTEALNHSNQVLREAQEKLEDAYEKLEAASFTDPLTGLHNRRFLSKSIVSDIAMVDRSFTDWHSRQINQPVSLPLPEDQDLVFMMLDIDFFKQVNDTYGHSAGDKYLEQLSDLLRATLRESDYLVRWGGEEFLIVVRYCNRREVPELAERIRLAVADQEFNLGAGIRIHKTCSIGMAAYPFYPGAPLVLTWEQVVDTADRALYLAKHHGRNCWVNVLAPADTADTINPAASDNLPGLAAAGAIVLESSNDQLNIH